MKANKLLLLVSSVGTLLLLAWAAGYETFGREWRQIQKQAARSSEDPFEVRLRQVVVPPLRITDRCISCHVGMAPGESAKGGDRMLRAHPQIPHDPAAIGCSICHGGQGRATEKDDAHGTAEFWPAPLIPAQYAEAGCGSCHTHLTVPNYDLLKRGEQLIERYDCLACHRIDRRGGTIRPGVAGIEGPDLSAAGTRGYRADWHEHHVAKAAEGAAAWNQFARVPDADREPIDTVLRTRNGAPRLVAAKSLFHSRGCRGCHKIGGVGGEDGPDLTHAGQRDPGQTGFRNVPGERSLAEWFKEHFRNPAAVVPGSQMPALGLPEDEIELLTLYMFSLRHSDYPEAWWPRDRIRAARFGESEFARDGATLFGTFCAACHGPRGQGMRYAGMPSFPAIGSPAFLELASDRFIAETIRRGRPGRRMPAWGRESGLSEKDIVEVIAHLRALGGGARPAADDNPAETQRGDAKRGAFVYAQFCAGCHGNNGEGFEGPMLANQVLQSTATDRYLFETIRRGRPGTSMEGFGVSTTVRPALSDNEIADVVAHLRTWRERE